MAKSLEYWLIAMKYTQSRKPCDVLKHEGEIILLEQFPFRYGTCQFNLFGDQGTLIK